MKLQIFKDRFGKKWITGWGVMKYFRRIVPIYKFYDYNKILKGEF